MGLFSVRGKGGGLLFRESLELEGNLGKLGRCWAGMSSPEAIVDSESLMRLGDAIAGSIKARIREERVARVVVCWVMRDFTQRL